MFGSEKKYSVNYDDSLGSSLIRSLLQYPDIQMRVSYNYVSDEVPPLLTIGLLRLNVYLMCTESSLLP